jgi:hypothetical protein
MPSAASRTCLRLLVAVAAVVACSAALAWSAGTARAVTLPPLDPGSILPGLPLGGGTSGSCPGAKRVPAGMAHRRARAVIVCAINRARKAHGLQGLRPVRTLRVAAGRHAYDMARHHYFAHVNLGGSGVLTRLHRAGWTGSAYGEALAWGCGRRASPRATVRAWLNSPVHRAILLSPLYRLAGIGIADRSPGGCRGGTWVLDAGRQ